MTEFPLHILCEDGPLVAVDKPAGLPTQGVPATTPSLEGDVKDYLKRKYDKPGNVYLGVPHRLDRPVSGVVIFARNSKAAARLAEQFRLKEVRKWYLGVVEGTPDPPEGRLSDWLRKVPNQALAEVVSEGTVGAKWASLRYRVLETRSRTAGEEATSESPSLPSSPPGETDESRPSAASGTRSLVLIEPETGRMHQIRLQFASRGWPIVGDERYGGRRWELREGQPAGEVIALHAARLDLRHPVRYDAVSLQAPLPAAWERFGFCAVDYDSFA